MITTKQKRTVNLQAILSVLAIFLILLNVNQKPLKYILVSLVFAYIGSLIGYNYRLRQELADKLNYRYVVIVLLVLAALTYLAYKLADWSIL